MPIKVHVKGKRRAPLPPTKAPAADATQLPPISPAPNNEPAPIKESEVKTRKKVAPTPPVGQFLGAYSSLAEDTVSPSNLNMTPNNLSACNSPGKLSRKKYEENIFFNIIGSSKSSEKFTEKELVHSANKADKGEPVLKNYRPHLDVMNECSGAIKKSDDVQPANDENTFGKFTHRNLLVWYCKYCTLENPFWKIVCAACDNMKPYDLPNTSPQTDALNLETKRCFGDERNYLKDNKETNDKKIDNLAMANVKVNVNHGNAYDEIDATNGSENVSATSNVHVQPYASEVVYRKKVNNNDADNAIKRNSEIIIKDYPTSTLEMEKQRLRAVIRSMNNRVLAEKYPILTKNKNVDNKNDRGKTPDYEAIDDVVVQPSKSGAIRKTDTKNHLQKMSEMREMKDNDVEVTAVPSEPELKAVKMSNLPDLGPSIVDNKEKSAKVSTSVQTDVLIKTVPATYVTLQEANNTRPQSDQSNVQAASSIAKNPNLPMNIRDLPDACYEYIGNLSMYGDQDVFTNTLKKLENALSDEKNESAFVEMNVSNVKLSMNVLKAIPAEKSIFVNLYINFNSAIEIEVQPSMLLSQLKNKIVCDLYPCNEQRIYFNGLLMDKEKSLKEYGIKEKSSIYLNTEAIKVGIESGHHPNISYVGDGMKFIKNELAPIPMKNDVINRHIETKASTSAQARAPVQIQKPAMAESSQKDKVNHLDFDQYRIEHTQLNRISIEKVLNPVGNPNITKNKYRGVYNYNPRYNPALVIEGEPYLIRVKDDKKKEQVEINSKSKDPIASKQSHYLELLSLDNLNDIASNTEPFDCVVCFVPCEIGEGVVLRDCLHTFCKECIRNTIIYSDDAEVRCPYIDNTYTCDSILQDREIKALLSKKEHDEHLAKSLRVAENQIENSFHCRTPNCKGWCIYEDNVNTFRCPICSLGNCLTCRVIHDGLNCKQYQENAKTEEGNVDNHTTKKMLDEMVENGEAMFCPTCRVVLMKKWGCDWLKCSMCKTEICWVTRGPRWGPAGKGDTSGGCKCGVGGFKCHRDCNYCH